VLNQQAKQGQDGDQYNSWKKAARTNQLDNQDQAGQHEQRKRHSAMESRNPNFQFAQATPLNLAAFVGICAGCFARARIARRRRRAVNHRPLYAVRKNRNQMLVPWAPPDILVRMVGETGGAESDRSALHKARDRFE
jgi:hypothetical protein